MGLEAEQLVSNVKKKKWLRWAEIMASLMHCPHQKGVSASKQTNNSGSFRPTSELMKWRTERIRLGMTCCLSIRRREAVLTGLLKGSYRANVHWNVISQIGGCIFDSRFAWAEHWLTEDGLMRVSTWCCLSALATHLFLLNSLIRADKTKWLAPSTFLFVTHQKIDSRPKGATSSLSSSENPSIPTKLSS